MQKVTIIDTDLVGLWYYPDKKIVHHKIKQFITGRPFREFLMAGTDLIEKHHAEKWLSDDRDCPVVRPEDIDWGDTHWFPKTAAAWWKYWATSHGSMESSGSLRRPPSANGPIWLSSPIPQISTCASPSA